jgi:hypothetical protein
MKNGIIYKIVSDSTDKIYIGSTVKSLEVRLGWHEEGYRRWINSEFKFYYCTSYEILKYGDYKIIFIEQINFNERNELNKLEGFYQLKYYYYCVNTQICLERPRHNLIDTQHIRYRCYCGREMYNKYKTRFFHIRTLTHKLNVIKNHKDIIISNEVDKILVDILDEFN